MTISNTEYWAQVNETAGSVIETAKEQVTITGCETLAEAGFKEAVGEAINDGILHETIDGHQWIIYYSYNLDILQHSGNYEYMVNELGEDTAGQVLKEKGLLGLHQALAFWALYADVQEAIQEQL